MRPDGRSLIVWREGKYLAWDATVVDTLKPSSIQSAASEAGAVAAAAEALKEMKYAGLSNEYVFTPLAFETLGPMGPKTLEFMDTLKKILKDLTGETRQFHFFLQRVSLSIVRNNCASVMAAMLDNAGYSQEVDD